ncbi:MAG: hypothetical protein M3R63_02585 [Actinomycetota bacterium]|nr:hypothetical protein [Actinomycetota bacterium]
MRSTSHRGARRAWGRHHTETKRLALATIARQLVMRTREYRNRTRFRCGKPHTAWPTAQAEPTGTMHPK